MENQNSLLLAILGAVEFGLILVTTLMVCLTYIEIKADPLDVNRDGVADITDLSVLAAKLNEQGQK